MDRREFVRTSSLVAGTAMVCPISLGRQQTITEELITFRGFMLSKPWDFDAAADYLDSLGAPRFPVLRAAMRGDDLATCCFALCMAKRMRQGALPLLPDLVALTHADRTQNWFRAVIAIGKIGKPAQAAAPQLERWLQHDDPWMRLEVANSLLHIQPARFDELSEVFHVALDHNELSIRACGMVGESGERGHRFLPQLESLVYDGIPEIRWEASRAIFKITNNDTLASVQFGVQDELHRLHSPDPLIRSMAAFRLRSIGPTKSSGLAILKQVHRAVLEPPANPIFPEVK
jgi:hypothetical protein